MRRHPLVRREMNLRMREWNAFWVPFLYVGSLGLLFASVYGSQQGFDVPPWMIGRQAFATLSGASLALLSLAVPVFAAGSITVEREQHTLGPLLLTPLGPRAIVDGKLAAAVAYALLLLSATLPVTGLAVSLGGCSAGALLVHYVSLGAVAVALAAFGLFVSAWFQRSVYAIALCYGALAVAFGVVVFTAAVLAGVEQSLQLPILRRLAFVNPLFFLEDRTRGQWPLAVGWCLALTLAFREGAIARLRREGSAG